MLYRDSVGRMVSVGALAALLVAAGAAGVQAGGAGGGHGIMMTEVPATGTTTAAASPGLRLEAELEQAIFALLDQPAAGDMVAEAEHMRVLWVEFEGRMGQYDRQRQICGQLQSRKQRKDCLRKLERIRKAARDILARLNEQAGRVEAEVAKVKPQVAPELWVKFDTLINTTASIRQAADNRVRTTL